MPKTEINNNPHLPEDHYEDILTLVENPNSYITMVSTESDVVEKGGKLHEAYEADMTKLAEWSQEFIELAKRKDEIKRDLNQMVNNWNSKLAHLEN